jgi:hypothetical protein
MIQIRPSLVLPLLLLAPSFAAAQAPDPAFRPGLPSTGAVGLEVVPSVPVEACKGRAGKTEITTIRTEGGNVLAGGSWTASPGTRSLAVEVRIDQDRQALTFYEGSSGRWAARFPFDFCGKHLMRVYAFAAVPGAGRTELCFEGAPSSSQPFEIDCTPRVALSGCKATCGKESKGKAAGCRLTCTGTAESGMGTLIGYVRVGTGEIQALNGGEAGPWPISVACQPGETVSFWVRDHSGTGATAKAVETLCKPR